MPFRFVGLARLLLSVQSSDGKGKTQDIRRFIKVLHVETAKGSGKTPLAGGAGLYCTVEDKEDESEGYVCARTGDQALVTFRPMAAMVRNSDYLRRSGAASWEALDQPEEYQLLCKTMSFIRRVATETSGKGHAGPQASLCLSRRIPRARNVEDAGRLRYGHQGAPAAYRPHNHQCRY